MRTWSSPAIPRKNWSGDLPALSLTNTATSTKEAVANKSTYRMYVCGITPYDATHLGHAATYLTFDLINRYLRATGANVVYVQNITDIDDPLLERATRDGVDWRDLAHRQIDLFRSDMEHLRVIAPDSYVGAVEAIPLVIDAIAELEQRDSIYAVDKDLYFSVASDATFGSRSHLSQEEMLSIFSERGGDPNRVGKRAPLDCLVWMAQRPNEPGWDSSLGIGRPGWHIECTAIALKYLDPLETDSTLIDIQGGGSDLIFPHHEMCAAQAHVMKGKELAATYVHAGMIGLDGEKMSKSKGNLIFVSRLVAEGTDPMAIRWALMSHHYRSDQMWSEQLLTLAKEQLERFRRALGSNEVAATTSIISAIVDALSNDLDTPTVISVLNIWAQMTLDGGSGGDSKELAEALDNLLGLNL